MHLYDMEATVNSRELAEAIVDRLFPMADPEYAAQRVHDAEQVIDELCFDGNYFDDDEEGIDHETDEFSWM